MELVPREYYLTNNPPVPKEGMETINIIAGVSGFKQFKYKVDVPGSVLKLIYYDVS